MELLMRFDALSAEKFETLLAATNLSEERLIQVALSNLELCVQALQRGAEVFVEHPAGARKRIEFPFEVTS